MATIDYLAKGGDYMTGLSHGKQVARSTKVIYDDILDYLTVGAGKDKPVEGDTTNRWTLVK